MIGCVRAGTATTLTMAHARGLSFTLIRVAKRR